MTDFHYSKFQDANEYESCACRKCAEPMLWFGKQTDRMYLTQTQVKELLPILEYFIEHGCLPD